MKKNLILQFIWKNNNICNIYSVDDYTRRDKLSQTLLSRPDCDRIIPSKPVDSVD